MFNRIQEILIKILKMRQHDFCESIFSNSFFFRESFIKSYLCSDSKKCFYPKKMFFKKNIECLTEFKKYYSDFEKSFFRKTLEMIF